MKSALRFCFLVLSVVLVCSKSSLAEVSLAVEEGFTASINSLSEQGRHLEALVALQKKKSSDLHLADKIAGARSAWALSLPDMARDLWAEILAIEDFRGPERSRIILSRAILEFQEGRYEKSRAYAEQGLRQVSSPSIRKQLLLVIAENLKEQGALSVAEGYYKQARDEIKDDNDDEVLFLLGECQLKLGLIDDARYSFAKVGTSSTFVQKALRRLAGIDLDQRKYDGVLTWIREARESFPEEFSDQWSSYALIVSLLQIGSEKDAEKELKRLKTKFSEKDSWYVLARAAYEGRLASERLPKNRR